MSTTAQPQNEPPFRPPLVSFVFAILWFVAAYWCFGWSEVGLEIAVLPAALAAVAAITQLLRAINDWSKVRAVKRDGKRFVEAAEQFRPSRYANLEDIELAKDFSTRSGIFLGSLCASKRQSQDVYYCGPGSISCIAPPGQYKTMGLAVPAIASGIVSGRGDADDLIINDISGELLSILTPILESLGYTIVVLTPFAKEVSAIIGREVEDARLELFSDIHPEMAPASVPTELERCMQWGMPDDPNLPKDKKYFYRDARRMGSYLSMREIASGRKPDLVNLRSVFATGIHAMPELYAQDSESTAFDGQLAETASALLGLVRSAPEQYSGGHGIADSFLDPFKRGSDMAKHVSGDGFDPSVFKKEGRKTAVIVVYTLKHFESFAGTMAMTMSYLLDQAAAASGPRGVTAIIDEAASLPMYLLPSKLEFYRKTSVRCLLIWQSLGQAEQRMGKAGMERILDSSAVKIGMGLSGAPVCELFSKLCGTRYIQTAQVSHQSVPTNRGPDLGNTHGYQTVFFLRPDEIRLLKQMLVIGPGLYPLTLDVVPYWTRQAWRDLAGPSPFYKGE